MTRLRMNIKNQSKKPLKARDGKKCCRGRRCNFIKTYRLQCKKISRNKNSKTRKKTQESSSKTKSTQEKINSDPKAPKMATRPRSQLKPVPEKLKNYFTEQDEEYFSNQETNDVFVSGKSRKK